MKHIGTDHIGFTEIGGAGEVVYRVIRFKTYNVDRTNNNKEIIMPVITPVSEPIEGVDYQLNGQELLFSLCNLYHIINDPHYPVPVSERIRFWCQQNVQPYNLKGLSESYKIDNSFLSWEMMQKDASFYVEEFVNDLCGIGMVMDFYNALYEAHFKRNPSFARNLYYEGNIKDSFPFFEKYVKFEDDEEYLRHIDEDFDYLETVLLGLFPEFKMTLQKDEKSGRIGIFADIDSIFDLCWYAFERLIASDAPPVDTDYDSDILYSSASYICCLACGTYVKRKGPRQKYCDNPACQAARKRINFKNFYNRQKAKQ